MNKFESFFMYIMFVISFYMYLIHDKNDDKVIFHQWLLSRVYIKMKGLCFWLRFR